MKIPSPAVLFIEKCNKECIWLCSVDGLVSLLGAYPSAKRALVLKFIAQETNVDGEAYLTAVCCQNSRGEGLLSTIGFPKL